MDDYMETNGKMENFISRHGKVRFIEVVESLGGFEPCVIWPGIKFNLAHIKNISHVAVVSDLGWLLPLSKAAVALLPTKLRAFSFDQLEEAKAWAATA